jgi:hypothetical protein
VKKTPTFVLIKLQVFAVKIRVYREYICRKLQCICVEIIIMRR